MNYSVLINKDNEISDNLKFNLIRVSSKYKDNILIEENTYYNYKKLKEFLKKHDVDIQIQSGYRTHLYQKKLFDNLVNNKGLEYALKYVAKPYHSEHETGLAIDFCIYTKDKIIEEHDLLNYEKLSFIHDNLYKFGFILRYKKNKEDITKYNYEPWHIRYVGNDLAQTIYNEDIALEEYYNKERK